MIAPAAAKLQGETAGSAEPRSETEGRASETLATASSLVRDLFAYAGARRLSTVILLVIGGALVESIGILMIIPVLSGTLFSSRADGVQGSWVASLLPDLSSTATMLSIFVGLATLLAVRAAVLYWRDVSTAKLQFGYVEATKVDLLRRLGSANWPSLLKLSRSRVSEALGAGLMHLAVGTQGVLQIVVGFLLLLVYGTCAALIAFDLFLQVLAALAIAAWTGSAALGRARNRAAQLVAGDLMIAEQSSRFMQGLKLAIAQDLQTNFTSRYMAASAQILHNRLLATRSMQFSRQVSMLFCAIAILATVLHAYLEDELSNATLIAFLVIVSRAMGPLSVIQQSAHNFAHCLPTFEELQRLRSELECSGLEQPRIRAIPTEPSPLTFVSVSYIHQEGREPDNGGLRDVSFSLQQGEFVGVAGPSGAGKTTLLDLAAGVLVPEEGYITVGGTATLGEFTRGLAYVSADPLILADTLRANLAWAASDADDLMMSRMLQLVGAHYWLANRGLGLDEMLSDAGRDLSAGERQQLALARALMRRPSLILIDEATCSMDLTLEKRLFGNLRGMVPRPTVLMVSHREESLAMCDRVLTIRAGVLR